MKREIIATIPAPVPAIQVPSEATPVGLRPGSWIALILVLVVVIGGATAWQDWRVNRRVNQLDNTIFGELSQIFNAIKK